MLPDFPKIKVARRQILNDLFQAIVYESDPLLAQIRKSRWFEGSHSKKYRVGEETTISPPHQIGSSFKIEFQDLIKQGLGATVMALLSVAQDHQRQMFQYTIQNIEDVTKKTGNNLDARGAPFSIELLFEMIEKVEIEFDDDGQARFPTFVCGPDLHQKVASELVRVKDDPQTQRRFSEIMEKKRSEWNDRESHRKLVD